MNGRVEAFVKNPNFGDASRAKERWPRKHGHTLRLNGFFDFYDLKTASQRRIFFEIFLVFRPGGRRDRSQLAAGQCWLQQIGGVALAGGSSGADHGVRLVDEQIMERATNFTSSIKPFKAVLEFTFDTGSGLQ